MLCESEGNSGPQVLALTGFAAGDFDVIWQYFYAHCGVYMKKHKVVAALSESDFDGAMRSIEDAADQVDEATQAVQKKAREADLMKKAESIRDGLEQAVSGDKQALSRVFSANGCERIGRLRLIVDTVQLDVYRKDPRWLHLQNMCHTIESVLKELGAFRHWRPPEDSEHSSLVKRMMVRELRRRQGEESGDEFYEEEGNRHGSGAIDPVMQQASRSLGDRNVCVAASGFAPYGAAHPQYSAASAVGSTAGLQNQERACANAGDTEVRDGLDGQGNDPEEEVSDPNASRASPSRDRRGDGASTLGANDSEGRAMRYTHPGSILEGWVWKRSRHLKRWRRRWIVLMPGNWMSFKRREDASPTETVSAGAVWNVYSADSEVLQAKCFCVSTAKRSYYMVCDDEAQKESWIRELTKALCSRSR